MGLVAEATIVAEEKVSDAHPLVSSLRRRVGAREMQYAVSMPTLGYAEGDELSMVLRIFYFYRNTRTVNIGG